MNNKIPEETIGSKNSFVACIYFSRTSNDVPTDDAAADSKRKLFAAQDELINYRVPFPSPLLSRAVKHSTRRLRFENGGPLL